MENNPYKNMTFRQEMEARLDEAERKQNLVDIYNNPGYTPGLSNMAVNMKNILNPVNNNQNYGVQ